MVGLIELLPGERVVAVSEEDARIFRTRFGAERVDDRTWRALFR